MFCKFRSLYKYTGSTHKDFERGGRFYSTNPDVNKAVFEADDALKSLPEERLALVVEMDASDDESADPCLTNSRSILSFAS